MPRFMMLMFVGPAEIRELGSRVITGLVTAEYISGLGDLSIPITKRAEPLGSGPIVIKISSTEV